MLNKGDEIAVRVVEVDKERGRIGLRLAEDPDIAGKTKEELASVGTGDPTMGGGSDRPRGRAGGDRGDRNGRAAVTATAAPAAVAADATAIAPRARRAAISDPDRG